MKRKDLVNALFKAEPPSESGGTSERKPSRVAAGSIRAMGLELDRLTEDARQASMLREQLAAGSMVVELDPEILEPSFIADRLAPTDDAQYRGLVDSIRRDGQKIPILVRPHPEKTGVYQIAYGHRRWHAARELAIKLRAIIQSLSDSELVVAQGKENSERRNLSFIERAWFAASLNAHGFDRSTINAAMAIHSAETSRLLTVAAAIPAEIVKSIGPAPKAGRNRWLELAKYLETKQSEHVVSQTMEQASFRRLGTNARFEALMTALRTSFSEPEIANLITNTRGEPVARVERAGRGLHLWIDQRFSAGFGDYLVRLLPDAIRRFDEEAAEPGDREG
jgi:ParB family chromosome partitioning protein